MKKTGIICLALVLCLLSGCLDKSYRGLVDVDYDYDPSVPIPVWIQIGEPSKTKLEAWSQTKGVGVIEKNIQFKEHPFYVYAFNQDKLTTLNTTNEDDPLRCLIDASIDYADPVSAARFDQETYHPDGGRQAWYDPEKQLVTWYQPGGPVYNEDIYWPMGDDKVNRYDFYAYYIDDIKPSKVTRTESAILVDIEIDGSQDVMSAVAMPSEEKLKAIFPKEEDYLQLLEYKYYYCYGHYSALKTLNPEFVFDHHLVRLEFYIIPGETPGYNNKITVHDITVRSKSKAEFTVAASNIDKDTGAGLGLAFDRESSVVMRLRNADGSYYNPDPENDSENTSLFVFSTNAGDPAPKYQVGGSLLVAPTSDLDVGGIGYEITVTLSETRYYPPSEDYPDGRTVSYPKYTNRLYLQNPSLNPTSKIPRPFQAGNRYQVHLNVHGHNDITVSTDIKQWDGTGDDVQDNEIRPGGGGTLITPGGGSTPGTDSI